MKKFLYSIIGVGVSLSAVAAFYSIGGLVKIFKGSATSIIILASALEAAKVLISVYLHIYWDRARKLLVGYLTFALVILAFITSLGIFGALSSAYFNSTDTEQLQTKISIVQSQIEIEQSKIRNGMSQISAIASIPKEEKQSWHFFKINAISKEIDEYTKEIDKLNESLMPLKAELNRINMEVGPLKFLAGWIYGETESATDKAVQLFIVMMVTVFDPLALLLIFAGIHGFEIESQKVGDVIESKKLEDLLKNIEEPQEEQLKDFIEDEKIKINPEKPIEHKEISFFDEDEKLDDEIILLPEEKEELVDQQKVNEQTEAEVEDQKWAVQELLASSFDAAPILEEKLKPEDNSRLLSLLGKKPGDVLEKEDTSRLLGLLGKQPNDKIEEKDIERLQQLLAPPKPKKKTTKKKKSNVVQFPSDADEKEIVTYTNNNEIDNQLKNINYLK